MHIQESSDKSQKMSDVKGLYAIKSGPGKRRNKKKELTIDQRATKTKAIAA